MLVADRPGTASQESSVPVAPPETKAIVIGFGAREHSIAWKLQQELGCNNVLFVPGNAGVPDEQRRNTRITDFPGIYRMAINEHADLVVVGPEQPLAAGIVDYFSAMGVPIFGPTQQAARLESSKVFSKLFMHRHGIPTADFSLTETPEAAKDVAMYLLNGEKAAVLKADVLAAGKGSFVCEDERAVNNALASLQGLGGRIIVEKYLPGEEVSYIVFSDGENILVLPPTQDHKRLLGGDLGPNTGGMGAYTNPKIATPQLRKKMHDIMQSAVDGMAEDGTPYKGVLYGGFMIVDDEPFVLEFNARFGDPETQPVMALMESSLTDVLYATMENGLGGKRISWKDGEAATVVMATQGYPDENEYRRYTGRAIRGLDGNYPGVAVFHAGTERRGDNVINSGGRVLSVTGIGHTLDAALQRAYSAIGPNGIHFDGAQYRKDVGWRSINRV